LKSHALLQVGACLANPTNEGIELFRIGVNVLSTSLSGLDVVQADRPQGARVPYNEVNNLILASHYARELETLQSWPVGFP
jgi:hypothetical protein